MHISSLVQQPQVKTSQRLSGNYLIRQILINESIACHALIFISSVDVPLDFQHSHLFYPCFQVLCWINSIFYISNCVTIFVSGGKIIMR